MKINNRKVIHNFICKNDISNPNIIKIGSYLNIKTLQAPYEINGEVLKIKYLDNDEIELWLGNPLQ